MGIEDGRRQRRDIIHPYFIGTMTARARVKKERACKQQNKLNIYPYGGGKIEHPISCHFVIYHRFNVLQNLCGCKGSKKIRITQEKWEKFLSLICKKINFYLRICKKNCNFAAKFIARGARTNV